MKHNTHIYIAAKSIEFLYEGLKNLKHPSGIDVSARTRNEKRRKAKVLQRMLMHYESMISEASWAPDDILNDKSRYHVFKLFTETDFPGCRHYANEVYNENYFRIRGSGGLPFKVDHLASIIADMEKLRGYNDRFSMQQLMYQYLLISHYVVDAHVPMHCDLRDDPPSNGDKTKPEGEYLSEYMHGKIEGIWDDAVTPVALEEDIIKPHRLDDAIAPTELSGMIRFDVKIKRHCDEIPTVVIPKNDIMEYMIDTCLRSKDRSLKLFPVDNPNNWNQAEFPQMTRQIFANAIGSLISIWIWIWS